MKEAFWICPLPCPGRRSPKSADDLKARNAVLRRFPEVEQIVGKGGRADTPTDPSPIEMVETVINLRPKEFWPKRKIYYTDAQRQAVIVLTLGRHAASSAAKRRGPEKIDPRSGHHERHKSL